MWEKLADGLTQEQLVSFILVAVKDQLYKEIRISYEKDNVVFLHSLSDIDNIQDWANDFTIWVIQKDT